uniref:Interleukin 19 n=1 Tax=Salvator merianae TaxID=96440 RepID=A0A8D0DNL6_SALMN
FFAMKIFFSQILFLLLGTAVMGDNFFQFGPCNISININEIWDSFAAVKEFVVSIVSCAFLYETHPASSDRCCLIHRVLRFYLDRVFRHCETENLHINRKISGIANSFLSIVKKFRECQDESLCNCGEQVMRNNKNKVMGFAWM